MIGWGQGAFFPSLSTFLLLPLPLPTGLREVSDHEKSSSDESSEEGEVERSLEYEGVKFDRMGDGVDQGKCGLQSSSLSDSSDEYHLCHSVRISSG